MTSVALAPIEAWHLRYVGEHARPADAAELWASSRMTPAEVLEYGARTGIMCRTALVDGVPACVFGVTVVDLLGGVGSPWMVATPEVERHARRVVELSRPIVADMADVFPLLVNFVDNRNRKAHRWLSWIGFTLDPPAPFGPDRLPFRRFTLETPRHV